MLILGSEKGAENMGEKIDQITKKLVAVLGITFGLYHLVV